jgi:peptidoglycan/LPS O-acetylase OafA/YrhL
VLGRDWQVPSPGLDHGRAPAGTKGRGDIQCLRAIAVLAVVLYHGGVPGVAGGYVGVDCFFVVSGYLITGLLVADAARQGRVSFSTFYARRARRILPAAVLVLSATVFASVALLAPLQARQVVRDCVASADGTGTASTRPLEPHPTAPTQPAIPNSLVASYREPS